MVESQTGDSENRISKWGRNVGKTTKKKKHKKATGGLDKGEGKPMTAEDTSPLIASIVWQQNNNSRRITEHFSDFQVCKYLGDI